MKKFLAIVETVDDVDGSVPIDPLSIRSVQPVPHIDPGALTDVDTFMRHWFAGIVARNDWESVGENLLTILIKSDMIHQHGDNISKYDFGSICRAALTYVDKQKSFKKADKNYKSPVLTFVDSPLGMMVLATVKGAGKMFRKGNDITVDWQAIEQHWEPVAVSFINQIMSAKHRADLLEPVIKKYLTPAPDPQSVTPSTYALIE